MRRWRHVGGVLVIALIAMSADVLGQEVHGVVVDQTGLPLPGATVQLFDGPARVASTTSGPDGAFALPASPAGDAVVVSLDGFETKRVPRGEAGVVTLGIAGTTETTTVTAPVLTSVSPTTTLLGNTVTSETIARLPSAQMKARESLPLLPSVIRGPDGLIQLGGAPAHDTPLFIDGFNVTDPATGLSSINLPYEAVRGADVLRDPMNVTYGGLLGGLVKIQSNPGSDTWKLGVQGVVPRPRFTSPGFGRIEGIFPRIYTSGRAASGRIHYLAAAEYDYERIPVPLVTKGPGPDITEESAILFARVDTQVSPRHQIIFEGLAFPSSRRTLGLSPRREEAATTDVRANDYFAGFTERIVGDNATVVTIQIGAFGRNATATPNGSGTSFLSPAGWRGNWFSSADRSASRYTAAATWERITTVRGRSHDLSISGELASRRMRGSITETPIVVENSNGELIRTISFGPQTAIGTNDHPVSLSVRDVWQPSSRLQIDGGTRLDYSRHGGGMPTGRVGIRYELNESGTTVLKAGYGSFAGSLPLAVPAFASHPTRFSRDFDPVSGNLVSETVVTPTVGSLRLPKAVTATIGLERQLIPGLDAQIAFTRRDSSRVATLRVPEQSGALIVDSSGMSRYQELQISIRRSWENDQLLFVSYVRSSGRGELNEFTALFHQFDAPILQPGGVSRLASDARHRVIMWGTFNLPSKIVVSPVTEWRTGFPYSAVNERYLYASRPNDQSFPNFISTDMVVYKTFTVKAHSADVGVQLFNVLNNANPRDVYSVMGAPRFGQFTNSVGRIFRGYMLVKWK